MSFPADVCAGRGRIHFFIKFSITFAGLRGVWSDRTSDLTMCSVPYLYFWKCFEAIWLL